MNTLEKHNKEVEEKFDEDFKQEVEEIFKDPKPLLDVRLRIFSKHFITSQNKSLLKKIIN